MMKKSYIALTCTTLLLAAGCGGSDKPKPSADLSGAHMQFERSIDYYLKGETALSDYAFARSEYDYRRMDMPCNVARMAMVRFMVDEEKHSDDYLAKAVSYAEKTGCAEEANSAAFLSNKPFTTPLEEPVSQLAMLLQGKHSQVADYAGQPDVSPRTASMLYRGAARAAMKAGDFPAASEYTLKALTIDKHQAWTLNLLRDEKLMHSILTAQGKPADAVAARIAILEAELDKKKVMKK